MEQKAPTILGVQALRGVCALVVTCAHLPWLSLPAGAAGVDVFFIISGFIMMHACRNGVRPGVFLRARFARVIPFYWLMIVVAAPVWLNPTPSRLAASFLFVPVQEIGGWWMPVLGQGWTLTYELVFYAAVAIVLPLRRRWRLPCLTAGVAAICVLQAMVDPGSFTTRGLSAAAFPEFLLGAWLYPVWQSGRLPGQRITIAAGFAGLAIIAWLWNEPGLPWRSAVWGLPALAITAATLRVPSGAWTRVAAGFRPLGDASYSLYLVHPLILRLLEPVVKPLPLPLALPVLVAACAVCALGVHHWMERPVVALASGWVGLAKQKALRRRFRSPARMAVSRGQ